MLTRTVGRFVCRAGYLSLVFLLVVTQVVPVWAGFGGNGNFVGGVSIDANGVLGQPITKERLENVPKMRDRMTAVPQAMGANVELRKISLKALNAACEQFMKDNAGKLPDEVKYLGGLQRIEFVLVYPELNDIVIAGPAEGWKMDDFGNVVGVTTGRPVLLLDDLLVAFRALRGSNGAPISCSIDPTEEGLRNLFKVLDKAGAPANEQALAQLETEMKSAFGPQQIKLQNVPATSHFARVLVAADYRMKRIAMNLDPSPVPEISSFVDMLKNVRNVSKSVNPRWWMACNYEPIIKSEDGLGFQLRGSGVKVMTEDEFVSATGQVVQTGTKDPLAQKWAETVTANYDRLAAKEPIFTELRNIMDLSVVVALIEQNDLMGRAGCSLPMLTNDQGGLIVDNWNAPKVVEPQCSFLKTRGGWLVTASGGVQIEAAQIAGRTEVSTTINPVRENCAGAAGHDWWWN